LGDALWEIDVTGKAPPRLIKKDLGGLNGFEVGPDGMIYGPLWFKGQVVKVNPANGDTVVINSEFQVPAAANLDGTVYISNMADNSIEAYNPTNGELRLLTGGKLAVPAGLKIDGNDLWVTDVFGFRRVDVKTGKVQDIFRMQASDLEYPFAIGMSVSHFALSSWFTGTVQLVERSTLK
jgi:outer membrane protein assembly factor BamB